MSESTRRNFLIASGAGAAAVGVAAAVPPGRGRGRRTRRQPPCPPTPPTGGPHRRPRQRHGDAAASASARSSCTTATWSPGWPAPPPGRSMMSSHREAPEISKDPVADNTDVYAFVSPDRPDTVTLIANFIPLQQPSGGPNFYEFGDDVLYEIHIANAGRRPGRHQLPVPVHTPRSINPNTFLYNTGPIRSITDTANWNRPQYYSVTRVERAGPRRRRRSTITATAARAGHRADRAAGQRRGPQHPELRRHASPAPPCTTSATADGCSPASAPTRFHVDLGSIFDLGTLRPFEAAHLIPSAAAVGRQRRSRASTCTASRCRSRSARSPGTARTPARRHRRRLGDRGVGHGQPPQVQGVRRQRTGRSSQLRPVPAGVPAGQPAVQRGHRADGREGPVERPGPATRTAGSPSTCTKPELAAAAAGAVPGGVPEAGGLHQAALPTCRRSC